MYQRPPAPPNHTLNIHHQMPHHQPPALNKPPVPTFNNLASNTYCEMCNARFSNVESYQAHMRNCHPSHAAKMPYLTSILSQQQPQPANIANNGIIIQLNGSNGNSGQSLGPNGPANLAPAPSKPHLTKILPTGGQCMVPSCNCGINSQNCVDLSKNEEYFILKETHYTCVQCHVTFYKLNDYMVHLKHEHCVEVYRCILCKQMQLFDNLNLLKEHFFQAHQSHKYDLFRCRLCLNASERPTNPKEGLFHSLNDLHVHLQTVHNQNVRMMGSSQPQPSMPSTVVNGPPAPPPPPPPANHVYQPPVRLG